MRFDVFHVLANHGRARGWSELLNEARDRVSLADELGFDGVWFGEHHFDAEGTDQLPNPVMLAADLAGRTKQIRLGMAAVSLPLWHPIRLAEDLAMLDHMTGGRLDVAFSRGILPGEIVNLNPDADRANEEQSRAIFAEHLEIVRKAWTADPFSWQSDRYQVPRPGLKWPAKAYEAYHDENGHMTGLAVIPQPLQQPMPPLYAVTQQYEGFRQSARQRLGVINSHATGRKYQALAAAYADESERIGQPLPYGGRTCVLVRDAFVADTDAEARRLMEDQIKVRFELIKRVRGLQEWLDEDEDPDDPRLNAMKPYDLMYERDYLLMGSPASVIDRIIHLHEARGVDHLILGIGRVTDPEVERCLHLLAEEVIPAVHRVIQRDPLAQPEPASR